MQLNKRIHFEINLHIHIRIAYFVTHKISFLNEIMALGAWEGWGRSAGERMAGGYEQQSGRKLATPA